MLDVMRLSTAALDAVQTGPTTLSDRAAWLVYGCCQLLALVSMQLVRKMIEK
jgi:hypothetical protein